MEEQTIDINELIKLESLPKIFYQLEEIGKRVDLALQGIENMPCDEENKQEVKKRKQEITKFKNMMEDRRKQIKNQVLEKYNEFNEKYELEIKSKLVNAENVLNERISTIETQQKIEKENELREFVKQHCEKNNINIEFDRIGLNITLSSSVKSLKEQALNFIERVATDLKLIELEEYRDEILLEYNSTLDFVKSKTMVIERHKQLEKIKKQEEENKLKQQEEEKIVETVNEIIAPVELENKQEEEIEFEEMLKVSFTVWGYKEDIKKIKNLIMELGLKYE